MSNLIVECPYTTIPNYFLDQVFMNFELATVRVLAFISRQTFGYHRTCVTATCKRIEVGTNLSERSVRRALKDLEDLGIVKKIMTFTEQGMSAASKYEIAVNGVAFPKLEIDRRAPTDNEVNAALLAIESESDEGLPHTADPESGAATGGQPNGADGQTIFSLRKKELLKRKEKEPSSLSSESDPENSFTEPILAVTAETNPDGALHVKELNYKGKLCTAVDMDDIVYAYNEIKGIKKIKVNQRDEFKDQLADVSADYRPEEVQYALFAFLDDPTQREYNFAPDKFLRAFSKYAPKSDYRSPPAIRTPPPRLEPRTQPPAPRQPASPAMVDVPIPAEILVWNSVVSEAFEVLLWTQGDDLDRGLVGVDRATWPKVCAKAKTAIEKGWAFVNLPWVLKNKDNRNKLLQGRFANYSPEFSTEKRSPAAAPVSTEPQFNEAEFDGRMPPRCWVMRCTGEDESNHNPIAVHERRLPISGRIDHVCQKCVDAGRDKDLEG